jgi:uncharacterized sulfatase
MSYLAADGTDDEQTDGIVAAETIRLLERHASGETPFFIAAGFYRPHIPYIAPKKYFAMHNLDDKPLPSLPANYSDSVPPAALASTKTWPNFGTTAKQARECILAYDASVSFVDAQVGRLLDALDRLKLRDSTIVVLWGDHGYHLGEHGLWRKNSLFEESARAPLIIRVPGTNPTHHDCDAIVEFIDIYPTVVQAAGLPLPQRLDGKSLLPWIRNPGRPSSGVAITQVQFGKNENAVPGRAVRTRRWRFIQWDDGRRGEQLYDHNADPQEMNNLADDPGYADVVARLRKLLNSEP